MDFILKEKDMFAPLTIAEWIKLSLQHSNSARDGDVVVPKNKIAKAARHLAEILDYQYKHGCVVPD